MRPALPSLLGLLFISITLAEPAAPVPRFDIDAAFAQGVDAICADTRPDVDALSEWKTATERDDYIVSFAAGLQKRQIIARGGYCGTVRREDRAALYGVIAGDAAASAAQTKAYQELRDALRDRKDKPRIKGGTILLHMAVRENDEKGLRLLLEAGIEPDLRGEVGVTALSEAIANHRLPLVKVLLEHRASVYQAGSLHGQSPLAAAVRAPKEQVMELVDLLLARGAEADEVNLGGIDDPALLAKLLKAGADVNATDSFTGETALHVASSESIARLLIDAGADVNAANEDGLLPLDVAKDPKVIELLRGHGARTNRAATRRMRTMEKLEESVPVIFEGNKLINILDYYHNCTGIPFCIDWRSLEAAGIRKDTPVTLEMNETSTQDSLRLVLGKVSVKMVFEVDAAGTLLIGTPESVARMSSRCDEIRVEPGSIATTARLKAYERMTELAPVNVDDDEITVARAIEFLTSLADVDSRVDWASLKDAGLDPDRKIRLRLARGEPLILLHYILMDAGVPSAATRLDDAGKLHISTGKQLNAFSGTAN